MSATWAWPQVVHRRLAQGHLLEPAPPEAVPGVVAAVCGVQAQVVAAAELGIGIRTAILNRAGLRDIVANDGTLVRTYAMRGTAYLLASDDLPLYAAAMRQLRGGDTWFTGFGLNAEQAGELFAATANALDGRTLTRAELVEELRRGVGTWLFDVFDESLADLTVVTAYAGLLAYGPPQGAKTTFVRPDQWCPHWREVDEEGALTELVRRYIAAYGPVTHNDLARWLGIKSGSARDLISALGAAVSRVDDLAGWLPADATQPSPAGDPPPIVRLLPPYDSYILGAGPLDQVVPPAAKNLIRRRHRGRYEGAAGMPVLLIDGEVVGIWERQLSGRRLQLTVIPVRALDDAERQALQVQADRLAEFLQAWVALTVEVDGDR